MIWFCEGIFLNCFVWPSGMMNLKVRKVFARPWSKTNDLTLAQKIDNIGTVFFDEGSANNPSMYTLTQTQAECNEKHVPLKNLICCQWGQGQQPTFRV